MSCSATRSRLGDEPVVLKLVSTEFQVKMEINENAGRYLLGHAQGTVMMYAYVLAGFLIPFTIGHPQELVGVAVNCALILAALSMKSAWQAVPLATAPSIGVLARGLIFGPYTPYLALMLPFIWAGNAALVLGIRHLMGKKLNYGISLGVSAAAKACAIFIPAFALVSLSILPQAFLIAMGPVQLLTALGGGILAYGLRNAARAKGLF